MSVSKRQAATRQVSESTPRSRNVHIFEREPTGHYVEPPWCSVRLFEVESFGPRGATVLDPGCGLGRILRATTDAGYKAIGADIVDRLQRDELGLQDVPFKVRNFLTDPAPKNIVSIVCNPDFKFIREFCERALEVADFKVAMISQWEMLTSTRAMQWLRGLPLETVYVLSPRTPMPTGKYIADGNKPEGGRGRSRR